LFPTQYSFYNKSHFNFSYDILSHKVEDVRRSLEFKSDAYVIIGAGPSGLAAAITISRLFPNATVIVLEKRGRFERFNVVNLKEEIDIFLRKNGYLEEFSTYVASQFQSRSTFLNTSLGLTALEQNHDPYQPNPNMQFDPRFNKHFSKPAVYNANVAMIQNFLLQKFKLLGGLILAEVQTNFDVKNQRVSIRTSSGELEVNSKHTVIADGINGSTVYSLPRRNAFIGGDMRYKKMQQADPKEQWAVGIFKYHGTRTFSVTLLDRVNDKVRFISTAFNHKLKIFCVNTTLYDFENPMVVLQAYAKKTMLLGGINESMGGTLLNYSKHSIRVQNRRLSNVNLLEHYTVIGDAFGTGSPISGLGVGLGLSLYPYILELYLTGEIDVLQRNQRLKEAHDSWILNGESKYSKVQELSMPKFESRAVSKL